MRYKEEAICHGDSKTTCSVQSSFYCSERRFIVFHNNMGTACSVYCRIITLLTKQNPIMKVGKQFLRKEASFYPLEDRDQQLFNQWIATSCLGLSLLFFMVNLPVVSAAFSIMVLIAAGVALMGYCIGCTIRYRYMMWKYKRKKQKQAA